MRGKLWLCRSACVRAYGNETPARLPSRRHVRVLLNVPVEQNKDFFRWLSHTLYGSKTWLSPDVAFCILHSAIGR